MRFALRALLGPIQRVPRNERIKVGRREEEENEKDMMRMKGEKVRKLE
jgi:hypothetical protein